MSGVSDGPLPRSGRPGGDPRLTIAVAEPRRRATRLVQPTGPVGGDPDLPCRREEHGVLPRRPVRPCPRGGAEIGVDRLRVEVLARTERRDRGLVCGGLGRLTEEPGRRCVDRRTRAAEQDDGRDGCGGRDRERPEGRDESSPTERRKTPRRAHRSVRTPRGAAAQSASAGEAGSRRCRGARDSRRRAPRRRCAGGRRRGRTSRWRSPRRGRRLRGAVRTRRARRSVARRSMRTRAGRRASV